MTDSTGWMVARLELTVIAVGQISYLSSTQLGLGGLGANLVSIRDEPLRVCLPGPRTVFE
jgi:hypothetical protein